MSKVMNCGFQLAGVLGFIAVAAGAYGKHQLRPHLTPEQRDAWETATLFSLAHAAVCLAAAAARLGVDPGTAAHRSLTRSIVFFAIGTILFAGSIYAMCLGAPMKIVTLTPVGGVTLLLGWASVAIAGL